MNIFGGGGVGLYFIHLEWGLCHLARRGRITSIPFWLEGEGMFDIADA